MGKEKSGSKIRKALRTYLPWAVTVLIFIYLFNRIEISEVIGATKRVDLFLFFPLLCFYIIFFFLWDAFVVRYLFASFGTPVDYRGMVVMRGATYLIVLLNYMAGQGGLALIMNRWKNISIKRATSVVLYSLYLDYFTLLAFCLAGAFRLEGVDLVNFFSGDEAGHLVRFVTISWAVFFGLLLFNRLYLPRTDKFGKLKRQKLFFTFLEAPAAMYLKVGLLKSVLYMVGVICYYLGLQAFGLHVPFLNLSVMLPLVWLIGSIPVTVMRMGTIQAAMVWLVTRYAQGGVDLLEIEAAVLAFSLLWEMGVNLGRFIIGGISITRVSRYIWMPKTSEEFSDQ